MSRLTLNNDPALPPPGYSPALLVFRPYEIDVPLVLAFPNMWRIDTVLDCLFEKDPESTTGMPDLSDLNNKYVVMSVGYISDDLKNYIDVPEMIEAQKQETGWAPEGWDADQKEKYAKIGQQAIENQRVWIIEDNNDEMIFNDYPSELAEYTDLAVKSPSEIAKMRKDEADFLRQLRREHPKDWRNHLS